MKSIRGRLVLGLLCGLSALAVVSGGVLYFHVRTLLTRRFDDALAAKARAVFGLIKQQDNGEIEIEFTAEAMPEFGPGGRREFFQLRHEDGTPLLRSPSLGEHDLDVPLGDEDASAARDIRLPEGRPGRAVGFKHVPAAEDEEDKEGETRSEKKSLKGGRLDIKNEKKAVKEGKGKGREKAASKKALYGPPRDHKDAYLQIVIAQDRSDLDRTLATLLYAITLAGVFLCAGTVAVTTITVGRGLRPLQRVADEAAGIDARSLDHRFSADGLPRELQPICQRLNESLERLEAAFRRERRFTADAAHELRTPIAELRSLADVALKWDGDPQTSLAYFRDARDIAQQMETIVTALLALARCQAGAMTVARQAVDLGDVVREAWRSHQPRAAERGLAAQFALPPSVTAQTDRTLLLSMAGNLLSNAVEYTPGNGRIDCQAQRNGSCVALSITNDTDALVADDLPHLFEPFWRKDAARTDSSHSGLGLTLVAAYAALLGGQVEATLPQPGCLCIRLTLPS